MSLPKAPNQELFDRFDYCSFEQDGKMGVMYRDGHWLIPPIYEYVHIIESNIVHIRNGNENIVTDKNGNLIRSVDFDRIKRLFWYQGNVYALRKGTKWAIATGDFKLMTDYEFDDVPNLGCAPLVVKVGNDWKLVDIPTIE